MPSMNPLRTTVFLGAGAALLALAGCASSPHAVNWNSVSVRDQHLFYPGTSAGMRPLAIVTAGANGMVIAGGPPAAAEMVVQDGRVSLLSASSAQALRAGGTQSLGAGQPLPVPPSGPATQR